MVFKFFPLFLTYCSEMQFQIQGLKDDIEALQQQISSHVVRCTV